MNKFQYYEHCGIFKKWHRKTLADFTNSKAALGEVLSYLEKAPAMFNSGAGVYLYGANGVGKSHLLNCAFKELIEHRYKVKILSLSDLVSSFTAAWYDDDAKDYFASIKNVQFLGIEEIGKEFRSATKMADSKNEDLIVTVLDNVLRYRLQNCLPVWFTSNLSPSSLKDKYSQDIFSMLKECAIPLVVRGDDFRDFVKVGEI